MAVRSTLNKVQFTVFRRGRGVTDCPNLAVNLKPADLPSEVRKSNRAAFKGMSVVVLKVDHNPFRCRSILKSKLNRHPDWAKKTLKIVTIPE